MSLALFKRVCIDHGTVVWPGDDIALETLYDDSVPLENGSVGSTGIQQVRQ